MTPIAIAFMLSLDPVYAAGYRTISDAPPNFAANGANAYFLDWDNQNRIRQNGAIREIEIFLWRVPESLTAFFFEVWRQSGGQYGPLDRISREDILPRLRPGRNIIPLAGPDASEGDLLGFGYTASSDPGDFLTVIPGEQRGMFFSNSEPNSIGFRWSLQNTITNVYVPIRVKMDPPDAVFFGDSLTSGTPTHHSYITSEVAEDRTITLPWQTGHLLGIKYQNMGHPGDDTTALSNRITSDVFDLNPRWLFLQGGINDVLGSGGTNNFRANYSFMLAGAQARGINVVLSLIGPCTKASNEQMLQVDSLNAWLRSESANFKNVRVVDTQQALGCVRDGTGKAWNIKPEFDGGDRLHLSPAGYAAWAQTVAGEAARPCLRADPAGIEISGIPGLTYQIEAADADFDWHPLVEITLTKPSETWIDQEAVEQTSRFYRAILMPME